MHLSIHSICHETILLTTSSASNFIIYACRTILGGIATDIPISSWTTSTEVANTGLPKLPLDDLKSLRHRLAELHVIQVIAWNTVSVYAVF